MKTDGYIAIAIILFVLSIVCERVSDLLKGFLNTTNTGIGGWLGNVLGLGDLNAKGITPEQEQKRSYRILKINFFCGVAVAIALHADLYSIVILNTNNPMEALGWKDRPSATGVGDFLLQGFTFIAGCFATGCFISFGSKFWHDTLDILLQVKNYRRVLADPQTLKVDNVKSLQTLLTTYQTDFIKGAYLEAQAKFMSIDTVKAISLKQDNNGYYFEITLSKHDPSIPTAYQYLLSDNTPVNVPIKVHVLGGGDKIVLHSLDLSAKVYNVNKLDTWGTLGCLVRPMDNQSPKRYILTCCHNVVHPVNKLPDLKPDDVGATHANPTATPIGKIYKADRNAFLDGALIEVNPEAVENKLPKLGKPGKARTLTSAEVGKVSCGIFGAVPKTKMLMGTVTSLYSSIEVDYEGDTDRYQLNNLITVSADGAAISEPGDSGSCVLDRDRNVLGLVVAGNKRETYVIPIETLLLKFNVQLV